MNLHFVCSAPYALVQGRYGFIPLAVPAKESRKTPSTQSYFIVKQSQAFQGLKDLKGHSFAFTNPESNSSKHPHPSGSRNYPSVPNLFSTVMYTYSHDGFSWRWPGPGGSGDDGIDWY